MRRDRSKRRPVLQMRGEDALHHFLRPLRNQYVELRGSGMQFVRQRRPEQAVFDSQLSAIMRLE